jgi:hypothetical protein
MALWITDADPVELRPAASEDDLQTVIRAVYRQVLGNTHVMDSQRLSSAESLLRNGDITVRGFVRLVAQSDLYQSLFFDTASPYRFIELNFKHLLRNMWSVTMLQDIVRKLTPILTVKNTSTVLAKMWFPMPGAVALRLDSPMLDLTVLLH